MANMKPFAVKGTNIASPKGKALWCKYKEPDTKFNAKGEYSTSLVCDPNDPAVQAYINKLEELRDIAYNETCETLGPAKAKGVQKAEVYAEEFDSNGNETGNIIFKYKLKDLADRIQRGNDSEILVVDAKKNRLSKAEAPLVGNGSEIRVVSYANPYFMASTKTVGISHIWSKMQIIDLVEFSGGGDDFDEEDGFEDTSASLTSDFDDEDDF